MASTSSAVISQPGPFQGEVNIHINIPVPFVFDNKARLYDLIRTARATIREAMVSYLIGVLPIGVDAQVIRQEFDRLFCYQGYKGLLNDVGQERSEWLCMQIPVFDDISGALQCVAHVYFISISRRTGPQQFTVPVKVAVITQKFTNPPLPGQSLPALPYPFPTNQFSMMPNFPSLMASNHRVQSLVPAQVSALNSVPIDTQMSFLGFNY